MRAAAEVEPLALLVDFNLFAFGQVLNQFDLIIFALGLKNFDGLIAIPDFARKWFVRGDDFFHFLFDRGEVVRGERLIAGEIVVEPVFNGRSDGHLRTRKQRLHGFGEDVGAVMADEIQGLVILAADEGNAGVLI